MNTQDNLQDRLQSLFPVYYRSGNILLINADCMDVMKHIKDREIELCITDPPYGIGDFSQSDSTENVIWNNTIPNSHYFNELKRVSKKRVMQKIVDANEKLVNELKDAKD